MVSIFLSLMYPVLEIGTDINHAGHRYNSNYQDSVFFLNLVLFEKNKTVMMHAKKTVILNKNYAGLNGI